MKLLTEDQFRAQLRGLTDGELARTADLVRYEIERRDVCEHGVRSIDYCEPCNREYKRSAAEHERELSRDLNTEGPPPSDR